MKQCVKVTRIDHSYSFFLRSHALVNKVACDLQSSLSSSLTVTCLQHVQFAVLYGKLHILHVSVVSLQSLAYIFELCKCLREFFFHFGNVHRSTNAGNNVLALCIGKEFSEQTVFSCSRVTGKCNTCTTVVSHVTKCHHLYVDSSSPGVRNIVVTTVYIGSRVVPGTEYSLYSAHQLLFCVSREICSDLLFVLCLELSCQSLQIFCCKLNVLFYAFFFFHLVDEFFEIFLADFHNNVGIHLDKSSVAVPCPARIAGCCSKCLYYFFIQTKVQDGIHHTRHRSSCTGTNGYKQRIFLISELLSCDLFQLCHSLHDLSHDLIVDLSAILIVLSTSFCCYSESLRNRQAQACHLSQVGTLATEKVSHVRITFGEHIHPFCHLS